MTSQRAWVFIDLTRGSRAAPGPQGAGASAARPKPSTAVATGCDLQQISRRLGAALLLALLQLSCASAPVEPDLGALMRQPLSAAQASSALPDLEARWAEAVETAPAELPAALLAQLVAAHLAAGDRASALGLLETALPLLPVDAAAAPSLAWLQLFAAGVYADQGWGPRALELAGAALLAFEALSEAEGQGLAHLVRARVYLIGGQLPEARAAAEGAVALLTAVGDVELAAQASCTLALLEVRAGEVEAGLARLGSASVGLEGWAPPVQVEVLRLQHLSWVAAGDLDRGISTLRRAIDIGAAHGVPQGVDPLRVALARQLTAAGRWREAPAELAQVPEATAGLGEVWLAVGEAARAQGDTTQAMEAVSRAVALCGAQGELRCQGAGLILAASLQMEAGALRQAAEGAALGAAALAGLDDSAAARGWLLSGIASAQLGAFAEAWEAFSRARPTLEQQDPAALAGVDAQMALCALNLQHLADASHHARLALEAEGAPPAVRVPAAQVLGVVSMMDQDTAAASRYLSLAIDQAQGLEPASRLPLYGLLLVVRLLDADLEGANAAWSAAMPLARSLGQHETAFKMTLELSRSQYSLLEPKAAELWHLDLLERAQRERDPAVELVAFNGLGRAHLAGLRLPEAGAVLEQGLRKAEAAGDRRGQGMLLTSLALVSASRGRTDEALALLRRARPLLEGAEPADLLSEAKSLSASLSGESSQQR